MNLLCVDLDFVFSLRLLFFFAFKFYILIINYIIHTRPEFIVHDDHIIGMRRRRVITAAILREYCKYNNRCRIL